MVAIYNTFRWLILRFNLELWFRRFSRFNISTVRNLLIPARFTTSVYSVVYHLQISYPVIVKALSTSYRGFHVYLSIPADSFSRKEKKQLFVGTYVPKQNPLFNFSFPYTLPRTQNPEEQDGNIRKTFLVKGRTPES